MAVTALDEKTALIVVDLQKGLAAMPAAQPVGEVAQQAAALLVAFRQAGLPVVLVNVAGGAPGRVERRPHLGDMPPDWTDFMPELDRQPEDHVVTKRTWGAFTHSDLDQHLAGLGVTQVVIVGVATSIGVESTARQAYEHGYNVTLGIDAMTDLNVDAHINSITRIFPRLGETGTAQEIIALLPGVR